MIKRKTAESKIEKVEQKVEQTKSDFIWEKIKNLPLDVFALPGQEVHSYVERIKVLPDAVHLRLKSTAVLPAIEQALSLVKLPQGEMFDMSPAGPYTVITIIPKLV
jgi:hypothetical protein